jgi:two-component system cell cycle sensor histidine kinase PleC
MVAGFRKLRMDALSGEHRPTRRVMQARLQLIIHGLTWTIIFEPLLALFSLLALGLPHSPFGPVPLWRLLLVLGASLAAAALAFFVGRRFRSLSEERADEARKWLLASQLVFSTVWGLAVFLFWVPDNEPNQAYVLMTMSLVASSMVFARAIHMPVLIVAICVQCGFYMLRLVTDHSPTAHIVAAMVPVYLCYLLAMGAMVHRRVNAMIAARIANEDLAAQLARTSDEALRKRYEAETANASKTAFLANMSHELRTPLNAIMGFSEIIARQAPTQDALARYREYAADIHNSGGHLLSLINDLLDVAKIEAGKMEIDPRPIDVDPVIEGVCRLVRPRVQERRQSLTVTVPQGLPLVMADERALRQMLLNLLSNAIKFTPEEGRIMISARMRAEGGLQISVADSGPGIPADKMKRVFEPFSQVDNRFDRGSEGTGLGLALVKGLVQLHGGRIWLESKPGEGLRAHLHFPTTVAAVAAVG